MGHRVYCQRCGVEFYTSVIYHPEELVYCNECELRLDPGSDEQPWLPKKFL